MSRGASGAVLTPVVDSGESPADSDERLVTAVRHGDDRAFEALYERYQRRIHAYVLGMVKDHGRAEDVTQEVFVSALRRMRATDRPIAFKPWVYEIAKNACIDAFRRSKRAEEVSYDAEEGLAPADHSRLASKGPSPEAAVAAKHELETLCGAFGGLSESHHRILVLRELEGLTYDEIGERMGMTRPAVESTLFRARRRLTEEYEELVSGARCARVQSIIATAVSGAVGVRDTRRLSRHLAHCQPCRREALAAGLDRGLLVRRPAAERIAEKVAGLLPFPALMRLRRGGDAPEPPGARLAAHLPALSDQLSGPWAKAATGAALLVAGLGAGVGVQHIAAGAPPARPALAVPAAHKITNSSAGRAAPTGATVTAPDASSRSGDGRGDQRRRSANSPAGGSGTPASAGGAAAPGAGAKTPSSSSPASTAASHASDGASAKAGGGSSTPAVTKHAATPGLAATTPDPVKQVTSTVDQAADAVDDTAQSTTDAVQKAAKQVTDAVDGVAKQVTGGGAGAGAVQNATDAVNSTVGTAAQAVNGTAGAATGTVKQVAGGPLGGS